MSVIRPLRRAADGLQAPAAAGLVSVVIPVLDEADAIDECLDRVAAQTWPNVEVVVADGGSRDGTREALAARAAADPAIRLVDNPGRVQSAGLNRALEVARGELVVRLDARSFVAPDYVERCVQLLRADGARAVVGGRMVPRRGGSPVGRGIAVANRSWWGAGPARFHRAGEAGPAETVYLGAFRRGWIEVAGGWAEDLGVNEDYELNHRIRSLGGVVWLDPSLEVGYQPRPTYRALARQYFRYGGSKAVVMRRHPRSVRVRQLAPAGLAGVAIATAAPGSLGRVARLLVGAHLVAVGVAASRDRAPRADRLCGAVAAVVMHWSWSLGLWTALVAPRRRAVR